jgi:TetR/AcrR family transcriptional regulator, transcriptional repressor for nem operon
MIYDILSDVGYHLNCQGRYSPAGQKGSTLRKSKQEAAQTRETIVAAAAALIRRAGIADTSLADMMAAAGLTHGGFYRHFRNKEQLISEALMVAGENTIAVVGRNMAKGGINAAVDGYLSKSHRDAPTPVCPFAAFGSEMARSGKETKTAATEILGRLLATLADEGQDREEVRGDAIVALSTMVGAMTLARIVADPDLSAEILARAKDQLRSSASRL